MLLIRTQLSDYRLDYRNSFVLATMNIILGMSHWKRKRLHDDMQKSFIDSIQTAYRAHPYAHVPQTTYKVSLGYYRGKGEVSGKKTKTLDIDNLAYIGKVAIDSLVKVTAIPSDSIFNIPEVRYVYLGEREQEEIWLQVERNCPEMPLETQQTINPSEDTTNADVPHKASAEGKKPTETVGQPHDLER